jgi:hypothetical protein
MNETGTKPRPCYVAVTSTNLAERFVHMNQDRSEPGRLIIRLHPEIRRWVEQQAAQDLSPMSAVINPTLRRAMEAERRAVG